MCRETNQCYFPSRLRDWVLGLSLLILFDFTTFASVRVALMDFICEDNSYRSTVGASEFTAALQARMTDCNGVEWVERGELSKAEAEFKLAGLGLIDRFESIRGGRWVKADWAVFGRVSTNATVGRSIELEIVDLERADVLAATNLVLVAQTEGPFKTSTTDLSRTESQLKSLVNRAEFRHKQASTQTTVALVFLLQSGWRDGLASIEDHFSGALADAATTEKAIHVIRFRRAGAAMDEADLVLSGLAQSDLNASEKLANYYVWGNIAARDQQFYNRQTHQWQRERKLEASLSVWDGATDPRTATFPLTNGTSGEAVARDLARWVSPLLGQGVARAPADGVRRRISESLVDHAMQMMRTMPDNWFEVVQVLETACFFDPASMSARELWVRVRWGRRPAVAALVSRNQFFFARRRSEAWQKYVEQFGFRSACTVAMPSWWETNSIASEYVLSAWRPFQMLNYAQSEQAKSGVPRDAGGKELLGWRKQFAEDLFSRLATTPEDPGFLSRSRDFLYGVVAMSGNTFVVSDAKVRQSVLEKLWPHLLNAQRFQPSEFDSAYRRGLALHFQELGRPGGDRALLAELDEAAREYANGQKSRPLKLPRLDSLDSVNTSSSNQ